VWRGGFGAVAIELAARGAQAGAADRDLLATTFTRRNAARLGKRVETRDSDSLSAALRAGEKFDVFAGEVHPNTGEEAIGQDLLASKACVKTGGPVLWLGLTRQIRRHFGSRALASRGAYSVWRMS
jgi:hypothetical protein